MPRKAKSAAPNDLSLSELIGQAEERIEAISRQRVEEVRALFDTILDRTQLTLREVYGSIKAQVAEAVKAAPTEKAGKAKATSKAGRRARTTASAGPTTGKRGAKKGFTRPPKFRHPDDASLTWAGVGSQPRWLRDAVEGGASLESFRIAPDAKSKAKPAAKPKAKVARKAVKKAGRRKPGRKSAK